LKRPPSGAAYVFDRIIAPLLLRQSLRGMSPAAGSLPLNLEGIFTALLA